MSLSLGRNYGFVHTSAEVLQQLNYMFGHEQIPAELQSLIFRPNTLSSFDAAKHARADMYFIELSSRKLLLIDDVPIQLNYVARRYQDFFANKARSRAFWSRAVPDRLAERHALLLQDSVFQRLAPKDADLLSRIVRRDMTDEEIERDMARMIAIIGLEKIVFVTHVNADTPDGMPIEARRQLIQAIKTSSRRLKAACYDPTALMKRMGQLRAMENDGLDLTHYTAEFSERLCGDLYRRFMAGKIAARPPELSSGPGLNDPETPTDFSFEWAQGRHLEVSRRLHDYVRRHPEQHAHRTLLGEIQFELGDYEGACAQLEAARAGAGANEKSDRCLMQAYFNIGAYEQARKIALQMLGEEIEAPDILRLCALASERLDDADGAVVYWKRLFRLSGEDADAADAVLAVLGAKDDLTAADEWAAEVQEAMSAHEGAFSFRWDRSLQRGDREALLAQAGEPLAMDEEKVLDLAQRASARCLHLPAAFLARTHGLQESRQAETRAWVAQSASDWLRLGIQALDADDLPAAADYLESAGQLKSTDSAIVRARRALGQRMRRDLRHAFIGKRYAEVFRIAQIARQTQCSFPELYSLPGRAHFALGDFDSAFVCLQRAAQEEGASINEHVQYARAASRSNHYGEAMLAYRGILKQADEGSWAHKEAVLELTRLEARTARAARDLTQQGDYDAAGALLEALRAAIPHSTAYRAGLRRLLAMLRAQIKALEPASADRRLLLGMKILRLDPEDEAGLRAAAIGAMRTHRFGEALGYWQELRAKTADSTQIDLNIQKCVLWIERMTRKSAA